MKTLLLSLTLITVSFVNAQIVTIPDANFKAYLVGELTINTNLDTEIQVSEANTFTGTINCASLSISDLTGIEEFTALTYLYCENNQLTSLDVSQNTVLNDLTCYNNQLTSLNISQNTSLTVLRSSGNNITSLDVSQNTSLNDLQCGNNQLVSLDVSQNSTLWRLDCGSNSLIFLDVSQNLALAFLWCNNTNLNCLNIKNGNNANFVSLNAIDNPNLSCIEVDDATWSSTNWTFAGGNIDATSSFSTNCNNSSCFCTPTFSSINETALDYYTAPSGTIYTADGVYTDTIPNAAGCDSIITIDLSMNYTGLNELLKNSKKLLKITDLMGRETTPQKNKVLIYIYSDGTTERIFKFE